MHILYFFNLYLKLKIQMKFSLDTHFYENRFYGHEFLMNSLKTRYLQKMFKEKYP